MWNLVSAYLEMLVSMHQTYHLEMIVLILDRPMELFGDVGHLESHFGPFGDGVSVSARKVHGLRQTYHRLKNCFVRT
jgi:hypothetical protein